MFIGLVKFEMKQWFLTYQDQFCAWFSLARLPTETARVYFLRHFPKIKTTLSFFFPASRACVIPRKDFFVPYLLLSHVKYYLNSQIFPPF